MAKGKRKMSILRRGALCALFGLVAVVPAMVVRGDGPDCVPNKIPTDQIPATVYTFDQEADAQNICTDDFEERWENMLERYENRMLDTDDAQWYRAYLSQFDDLKDRPLRSQALMVTWRVNDGMNYIKDNEQGQGRDHWQDPVTTAQTRLGDCEDYAIQKYFALRYLGVPAERLLIATVNSEGIDDGVNHAVLLVNTAPDGDEFDPTDGSNYVILDQGNSFNDTAESDFVLYGLRNELGYWQPDPSTVGAHSENRIATTTPDTPKTPRAGGLVRGGPSMPS